ncbi:MAG: class I SAM-dependent methyltransferase [Deltaproteobacteria bacterium]|nr:class I SAM-dependent methyltransferase [Deltaproteobacteria bacterium]
MEKIGCGLDIVTGIGTGMHCLSSLEFETLKSRYKRVLIDIGTGDGKFPLRWAREHRDTFCVGMDPNFEVMKKTAFRASRKMSRGGVDNLIMVRGELEHPPSCLSGQADMITVLYPWAALLRAIANASHEALANISRLARPGCEIRLLINTHVFEMDGLAKRLGLPNLDQAYLESRLVPALDLVGIRTIGCRRLPPGDPPLVSTWGKRLSRASRRETFDIQGIKQETEEP